MIMHRRVAGYIGNRGPALGLLGQIWVLVAVGMLAEPPEDRGLIDEDWPLWLRAGVWLAPGVVALTAAFWRRLDRLGWGLLMVPAAGRVGVYAWGSISGTYPDGWRGALAWLAVVLLIYFCARGLDRAPLTPWDGVDRRRPA